MKTSNQLILLIVLIFFGAIIGSAMILKQEYQKIDFDDPFYGLVRNELPDYSVVKLKGDTWGRADIRHGEHYEFLYPAGQDFFKFEVRSDTLVIEYTGKARRDFTTTAYVLAPQLSSVYSEGFGFRLHAWQSGSLQLHYSGENGFLSLTDNRFEQITVKLSNGGTFRLEEGNLIGLADIQVMDSSTLVIEQAQIDSLVLNTTPEAKVQLPGALLEKIKR